MFVGEGPGENEDLEGRPFVGKAGQLLDRMIEAMGLTREQVYIANVVKCRCPEIATPSRTKSARARRFSFAKSRSFNPKSSSRSENSPPRLCSKPKHPSASFAEISELTEA